MRVIAAMAAAAISNGTYARGLFRAFGGALLFAFPLLMTMEMWELGFYMDRGRLLLFLLLSLPLLHGLSYFAGFRVTHGFKDDALDALAALAVGFATAILLLILFGVLEPGQSLDEQVGKVSFQAVPAAIGALVSRKQMQGGGDGEGENPEEDRRKGYLSELFLMTIGALFVAFNVAPTEEMILIGFKMTAWHSLVLMALSVVLLHAVVYSVGFAGQEEHESQWQAFWHFTVPGYAIALLVGLYALWTFGRLDGQGLAQALSTTVVLAFPGALGAAAARLLV